MSENVFKDRLENLLYLVRQPRTDRPTIDTFIADARYTCEQVMAVGADIPDGADDWRNQRISYDAHTFDPQACYEHMSWFDEDHGDFEHTYEHIVTGIANLNQDVEREDIEKLLAEVSDAVPSNKVDLQKFPYDSLEAAGIDRYSPERQQENDPYLPRPEADD